MFAEDARTASGILGVVLTSRQGVPMCGIPYHSSSNYIAGSWPPAAKWPFASRRPPPPASGTGRARQSRAAGGGAAPTAEEREKIQAVQTRSCPPHHPGTIVEDELLQTRTANYLAAVEIDIVGWGLSYIEASTGGILFHAEPQRPQIFTSSPPCFQGSPSEIIADAGTIAELRKRALSWAAPC